MFSSKTVVLNLFHISYPFIKQDYPIYPQHSVAFISEKYEINKLLHYRMICKNLYLLYGSVNLPPQKNKMYPQG